MRFETLEKAKRLLARSGIDTAELESLQRFDSNPANSVTISFELRPSQVFPFVGRITRWIGEFDSCMMLVLDYGVWPSSENWHLYESLRAQSGNNEQLAAAPLHIFGRKETPELMAFLHLAVDFGWGVLLAAIPNRSTVFLSHDGWIKVVSDDDLETIVGDMVDVGLIDKESINWS